MAFQAGYAHSDREKDNVMRKNEHRREPICRLALFAFLLLCPCPWLLAAESTATPEESPAAEYQLTFGLDQFPALEPTLFGIAIWQFIAAALFAFCAWLFTRACEFLIWRRLETIFDRTEKTLDNALFARARGPAKGLVFVTLLHIGRGIFVWEPALNRWVSHTLTVSVVFLIVLTSFRLIDLFVHTWSEKASKEGDPAFNKQLVLFLRTGLKFCSALVGFIVAAQNLGINISGFIASLSIGALAVGLAAKDTIANLFGAVALFLDKPFKLGERVQVNGVDGPVESIGLRSTRIRNLDGHLITVPNQTMGNATITNISRRPNIKTVMNLALEYRTSPEKMREGLQILDEVYTNHPNTENVWINFNRFEAFSLNIQIIHWWNNVASKDYLDGMQEMNLTIKERFAASGIQFAFPTQTVQLETSDAFASATPAP